MTLRSPRVSRKRVGNTPYGYRKINGENIKFKKEQQVIESILKMHEEGLSNRAIARILNEMKVPTKKQGKAWHYEIVRQIIERNKKS